MPYGTPLDLNGVRLSLHPAGHILGSAQVRLERNGEVWVVTGDFKRHPDPTCAPFEPLRCHTLVTESTFGLPVFRLARAGNGRGGRHQRLVAREQQRQGEPSVLFAYALGKAQRILAQRGRRRSGRSSRTARWNRCWHAYRQAGIRPPSDPAGVGGPPAAREFAGALVIAPPSAEGSPWMRRFSGAGRAFASGWMQIRGNRRRRALDRGFVLSDHADWKGLLDTIYASGAERSG